MDVNAFFQNVIENALAEVLASFAVLLFGGLLFVTGRKVSITIPIHPALLWMCLAASVVIIALIILAFLEKPVPFSLSILLTPLLMYIFWLTPRG